MDPSHGKDPNALVPMIEDVPGPATTSRHGRKLSRAYRKEGWAKTKNEKKNRNMKRAAVEADEKIFAMISRKPGRKKQKKEVVGRALVVAGARNIGFVLRPFDTMKVVDPNANSDYESSSGEELHGYQPWAMFICIVNRNKYKKVTIVLGVNGTVKYPDVEKCNSHVSHT